MGNNISSAQEISSINFTKQRPFVVTVEDCKKPWGGHRDGRNFKCVFCNHQFVPGDIARWQFTNDVPGAGGNPFVCQSCDGTREEIIDKMKRGYQAVKQFRQTHAFFMRD